MNILNLLCVRVNLWLMRKELLIIQYQQRCIGYSENLAERRLALTLDIDNCELYLLLNGIQNS